MTSFAVYVVAMASRRRSTAAMGRPSMVGFLVIAGCFNPTHDSETTSEPSSTSESASDGSNASTSEHTSSISSTTTSESSSSDSATELSEESTESTSADESCVTDQTRMCGISEVGACTFGVQFCLDGAWDPQCRGEIEPSPRNCFSSADNDCNGVADNVLDDICVCAPGTSQPCDTHSQDGTGACQAGTQRCEVAADKSTSAWGACEDAVGPADHDDCDLKIDADCDGALTCDCLTSDDPVPCGECDEGLRYCTSDGQWGECEGQAGSKITYYLDADGDNYGAYYDLLDSCTGLPPGYVENNGDCCDVDARVYAGAPAQEATTEPGCPIAADFNCDGEAHYAEDTSAAACQEKAPTSAEAQASTEAIEGCEVGSGWIELPNCGSEGVYLSCQPLENDTADSTMCKSEMIRRFVVCE